MRSYAALLVVWSMLCLTLSDKGDAQAKGRAELDYTLQQGVMQAMAGKVGTAVVIDVATGKILASYHLDIAAQRLALPGSSIKTFTLLGLLEAGKIDEQTRVMCKRPLTVGGHQINCTHTDTKQPFDPVTALAYSCNSYFATVGMRMSAVELQNSLLKRGFGSPSGLADKEVSGRVLLAQTQAEQQLQAIGEWGLHVSPLELLRAYQNLALMAPSHEAKLDPVFEGLDASVSYGMGHLAQPQAGMKAAGKTGTSLVEEGHWRHGWFAGYAPADKPEIALVVYLEKGNGPVDASGVAGKIFSAYAVERERIGTVRPGR